MKKYKVIIEEPFAESFEFTADSDDEAEEIVIQKYESGEFAVKPGVLIQKQMEMTNITDNYVTEWIEF